MGRILCNAKINLTLACLIFLLQALPLFSFRWVEDESFYSSTGYNLLAEGQIRNSIFSPDNTEMHDSRPLAMPATLAGSFGAFGVSVASARLPELLACLLMIPLVFWLGVRMGSPEAGGVAALLTSVDNAVFLAGRTVRPEAFVACFGLLAVNLYFLSRERKSLRLALLCGLSLGLAFNYHVNGYAVALSVGLLLLGEYGFSILRQKRAWVIVLASVATLIPFVLWLYADPIHMASFAGVYSRGSAGKFGLADTLHYEAIRYGDFLGIGNQRMSFIRYPIPLRLHIVLLIVVSLAVLARKRRPLFWTLAALIVPSLLLWSREKNATARFFVILAPYFAIAVGMAFTLLQTARWRKVAAAWCVLVFVSQAAANGLILWRSRVADYNSVTRQLRALIPSDARVFGTNTFYLALHDRPYYGAHYADFDYAIRKLGVNYLILNDRVMMQGSGYGDDEMRDVRERSAEFVKTDAEWVGHVPDPFYGDLQVYRVRPSGTARVE
jgi:4-amino-4-deoxy-L-arabinose transferase-like glycosyltransferase